MPPAPPLSGSLEENSLPKILNRLHEIKATGTLSLAREGVTKRLFIKNGGIVFASSSYEGDRLGEVLLKAGKINLKQFETASRVMRQMTGKRLGGVLVELGYLKPRDLFWGVKHQVQEIVSSLFDWTDGEYHMVPGEPPAGEVITLHMSTANLILHGIKRINDWTRISRGVPPMDSVLALTMNPLKLYQDISLTEDEKRLFSLFDGSKSIKDALAESGIGDFEALKAVYVFYSIGMLEEKGNSAPGMERPSLGLETTEDALGSTSIHKAYIDSKSQNHYELLGVDSEATVDEITAAYRRLSRLYHSDQHYREGMEQLKGELEDLFGKVKEAHIILSDNSRRWEYDLSLATVMDGRSGNIPKPERADDAYLAKEEFAKGVEGFKTKDFESAAAHFKEATRLDPSVAAYFSNLALALALLQRPRREAEAEEAMLAAIAVEPENAEHRANLGLLYQRAGMKGKAKEAFAEALRLDPENQKALKALNQKK